METIHVKFDELTAMDSEHDSLEPIFQRFINDDSSAASMNIPSKEDLDNLFGPMYEEYFEKRSSEMSINSAAQQVYNHEDSHSISLIIVEEHEAPPILTTPEEQTIPISLNEADADHAGCKDDCKSTSEGIQFLGDKLVSWSSKKKDCTVMSTTKAEYVSFSTCCAQVIWMHTQLLDYGYKYNKIPMYCDSKSAIAISCNPVKHSCTTHINIRYHFIKEHVENGIVELYFIRTEYQLADLFTQALPKERFEYLVHRIVIIIAQPQRQANVHQENCVNPTNAMLSWMLTRLILIIHCVQMKAELWQMICTDIAKITRKEPKTGQKQT
nr:retrovirus-related Pol polyprotein from transposon TNT 1-94 [Tanacetum cinerariifolium]GEY10144.1 retrovirus-related Pol polyprotein from transposon TNT 1-94 [Tanacetum cinerariifolium]